MILVAVDVQPVVARGKLPDDLLPRPSPQTETELGQTAASSVRHAHSCSFGSWQGERAQTGRSTPRESPQDLRPAGTEKTGIPGVHAMQFKTYQVLGSRALRAMRYQWPRLFLSSVG